MAIKISAVLEDAIHEIPMADFTSGAPLFEWTIPPPGSGPRARHEAQSEPDNYQVALVSFHNGQDRTGGNPLRTDRISRLFLLPLTWRGLVTQVCGARGHSNALEENKTVRFGRVSIDPLSMEVRRSDCPVSLTAMEFKVLKFFVSNPNRVISRDQLLNEVWGYDNYPCTRTVDNHVLKLRQKLESEPAEPVHFRTVHGIGYKFIP
jgi:DNA-binding winged helix-turn-helix (wHTH) protein